MAQLQLHCGDQSNVFTVYAHNTKITLIPWLSLGLEHTLVPSPQAVKRVRFHQQSLISKTHDSGLYTFCAFWKLYPIFYLCQSTVSLKYCFQILHIFSRGKSDVCYFAAISNSQTSAIYFHFMPICNTLLGLTHFFVGSHLSPLLHHFETADLSLGTGLCLVKAIKTPITYMFPC